MQVKRASIQAQDYEKVMHIEASANHWSLEHTRLAASAMDALSTFRDLTQAKKKVVSDLCKAAGLDLNKIVQARLVKDKEGIYLEVALQDDQEQTATTNGAPEPPPAAPVPEPAPAS